MQTHQGIIVTAPGGIENMRLIEEPLPEPRMNRVRVRIETAGVSWGDIMMRHGIFFGGPLKFPLTLGYDFVGRVEAVGPGADPSMLGRRVAGLTLQIGYAQTACVSVDEIVGVPESVDAAEAVAVVLNYTTAYQMLHRAAKLKPRQRILVFGAAGGVGTAILELGALHGLELYGAASAGKRDVVESYGATFCDSRSASAFTDIRRAAPQGFDAVFDPFAGRHVWRSYRLLRPGGVLVAFGISDAFKNGRRDSSAVLSMIALLGVSYLNPLGHAMLYAIDRVMPKDRASIHRDLRTLFGLLADQKIHPKIAQRLPLAEAAEAHRIMESFGAAGKIVLEANLRP
jgi:NADPH:quinone reductase-like Zn-dependent oxidoreductase